ncbi:hypothetical protein AM587_10011735 [Phytophthora nicotianae]|uniref:Uncharacterized protein n=1 Tax=Phytophthora nicotianae TaxID=4792 RepID=A0A0W8C708_PHYNI|nr:hypothetical protein AM587_10011735 [Phytophthora nicotianae]
MTGTDEQMYCIWISVHLLVFDQLQPRHSNMNDDSSALKRLTSLFTHEPSVGDTWQHLPLRSTRTEDARTHKTAKTKAKMVEQEHVAEEARQGNLALLHAALAEDSDAHERAEDATEGASDEGEDAGEAQKCLDTSSEAKKTTDDEEDASGEDEEDEEAGEEKGDDGEEEQVASDEEGEDEVEEGGVEKETTRKRRQGKKRTVSDVEEEDLVQVPAFKAQRD